MPEINEYFGSDCRVLLKYLLYMNSCLHLNSNGIETLTLSRLVRSLCVTFCAGLNAPKRVCRISFPAFMRSEVIVSVNNF